MLFFNITLPFEIAQKRAGLLAAAPSEAVSIRGLLQKIRQKGLTFADSVIYFSVISIGTAFQSRIERPPAALPAKAIRTAGSNAENRRKRRLATSVALLVELKAQFYKLVPL